jgi:hypothetical protein
VDKHVSVVFLRGSKSLQVFYHLFISDIGDPIIKRGEQNAVEIQLHYCINREGFRG